MPLSLILAAATAVQPSPVLVPPPAHTTSGRAFVSPMGEPFFTNASGSEGLTVWFAQTDRNHDGAITPDEMTADAARFFKLLDVNGDGEIDPDEVARYEQTIQPKGYRYSLLNIPEPVISADSDLNRGVSVEEFRRAAQKRFQLLDLKHSGQLTLPVLQVVREAAADQAKRPLGYKPPDVPLDPKGDTESIVPPR